MLTLADKAGASIAPRHGAAQGHRRAVVRRFGRRCGFRGGDRGDLQRVGFSGSSRAMRAAQNNISNIYAKNTEKASNK